MRPSRLAPGARVAGVAPSGPVTEDRLKTGLGGAPTPGRNTVLALPVLALVLIFENTRPTRIRLLVPDVTVPLWTALLAMGIIGWLCGAYFMRRGG